MVVMLTTLSSGCPRIRLPMRLAPSTEPEATTMVRSALSNSSATTAPHQRDAGLRTTISTTTP